MNPRRRAKVAARARLLQLAWLIRTRTARSRPGELDRFYEIDLREVEHDYLEMGRLGCAR